MTKGQNYIYFIYFLKIVDNVLNDVLNSINEKYNIFHDLAIEKNVSSDFCFGIKSIYGMHISAANNCDSSLNFTLRCTKYNQYLKSQTVNFSDFISDVSIVASYDATVTGS